MSNGAIGSIHLIGARALATSVRVERAALGGAYGNGPLYERRRESMMKKDDESSELSRIRKPLRMIMFGKPGSGALSIYLFIVRSYAFN